MSIDFRANNRAVLSRLESRDDLTRPQEKLFVLSFALFLGQAPIEKFWEFVFSLIDVERASIAAVATIYAPYLLGLGLRLAGRQSLRVGKFLVLYFTIAVLFLISWVRTPRLESLFLDSEWAYNALSSVFSPSSAIFAFLFITTLRDSAIILRALTLFAYLNFAYSLVRFAQARVNGYWTAYGPSGDEIQISYNLGFGYDMLEVVLIFMIIGMRGRKRWLHFSLACFGVVLILIAGSRAALAIAIVGVFVLMAYQMRSLLRKPMFVMLGILATGALGAAILNLDAIIRGVSNLLARGGIESRSLDALLQGSFDDDNGRDKIYGIADRLMADNPVFGYGFYGDRYFIVDQFWWGYPHSIFYEMLLTFGSVFGVFILVGLAVGTLVAFARGREGKYRDLVILFAVLCVQLLVSNSYLYSFWFWSMLAIIVTVRSSSAAARQVRPIGR